MPPSSTHGTSEQEDSRPETATENEKQSPAGSKQHSAEKPPSTPTNTSSSSTSQSQAPGSSNSRPGSQSSATPGATGASPQGRTGERTTSPKTDTMQGGEEKEGADKSPKDDSETSAGGKHTFFLSLKQPSLFVLPKSITASFVSALVLLPS